MITGNFALLAGIHPDEVDEWYLGIYIDALQWVGIVNTREMSLYADGGLVATKPYISSANHIHKMSDYCQDCHHHWRKPVGERARPSNSLYRNMSMRMRHRFE
jgi:deoxyribodipyrimidine photolyase-related protein